MLKILEHTLDKFGFNQGGYYIFIGMFIVFGIILGLINTGKLVLVRSK